jgi:hypothetical protein
LPSRLASFLVALVVTIYTGSSAAGREPDVTVESTRAEQETRAPATATEAQNRAAEEARLYCSPESLDTDARFVLGNNIVGVKPISVEVHAGALGETPRLEGVRLRFRAAPGLTREWLMQVLLCHRAQGVLGKLPPSEPPSDPFWSPEKWISIDVRPDYAGFAVDLTTEDPSHAEQLLARATAFAQAHGPVPPAPAAQTPETKAEPFAWADWGWMNGTSRQVDFPMDSKVFTGAFNVDVGYNFEFSQPKDHTILGSTASFRHNELQVTHLGVGADLHWNNVRGRFMTQLGLYSTTTPRNDASPGRGQWDLANAYRYLAEVYGGYHFDVLHGINVDAGIFLSYVGLCSYYNYENWTDQASYVSSNTPWFFNGVRIQIFPTDRLKIEPWIINGWQAYGEFNEMPGLGLQVQYRPNAWLALVGSAYFGKDTLGNAARTRYHSDNSVLVKYLERPRSFISRGAISLTADIGCEDGGGVSCWDGNAQVPAQYFAGVMLYNRLWFWHSRFALTAGGGAMVNPGRYLVLTPPINGATAFSGTPYFTQNPGDDYKAWDTTWTFDYLPSQFLTLRSEFTHRWANVPYFVGPGGITPPGGNQGPPGSLVPSWKPDLQNGESRVTFAIMVRI